MKFAAILEYNPDAGQIDAVRPAHRLYLRTLLESGRLIAAGPFDGNLGALIVYEADSVEQVEGWVQGDPYHEAGVIASWRIRPFVYWSAKAFGPGKDEDTAG